MANVVTNAGRAIITNRIKGAGTEPTFGGWGTGVHTSVVGDTALSTEVYSNSNDGTHNTRPSGTSTQQTTSVTNDTYRVVVTLTCAAGNAPLAIVNAGLFDTNGQAANLTTNTSGGNMFVESDFSAVNLNSGDSIQFTFSVQMS